jgi:nicotinamidase-related amidase
VELEFQLEEQTKRHILRIAELEATIQSHGIAIKTATGGVAHYCTKETLLDAHAKQVESEGVPCSTHPDAPHGFARDASHSAGRYVCECHGWTPE